ncbi:ATPase (AAA+ superfamily)-like protein [Rhizorhabdus wittichii RW1]|uniref:ATPase (AAA+ superfamily)-like protein n=1 Tax=Rhizorhabdus wittichii (strain DSM 6014 / CCUG 31198 / JCM 15750 / NBRC 105917 / EY 4224 / RW1) TaxID=392499 RepID=A0A9J9H7U8_RHIWR|nr:ATPase (AAA+ superfamily)-like protein [Rhizorhabdus wittichii RW1]
MAKSTRQYVFEGMELLPTALIPFVEKRLENSLKGHWQLEVVQRVQGLKPNSAGDVGWDQQGLLKTMMAFWKDAFATVLGHPERSYVSELLDVRNRLSHNENFTYDDAERALDTMRRMMEAISAGETAEQLSKMRDTILRTKFTELQRNEERRKTQRLEISVETVAGLLPWREVVEPHQDVATGEFQQAEFAADLAKVHSGSAPAEYRDPKQFFSRTYLTEGLSALLVGAAKRLSGTGGDPVVELQTNFGGGKTHSMLALYHMAGTTPVQDLSGLDRLLDEHGLSVPKTINRAVLVGTSRGPQDVLNTEDGRKIRTTWGDLAWQLGGAEAFDMIAENDANGIAPGSNVLEAIFKKFAPCLILIDEWVAYLRQIYKVEGLPSGSFDANLSFVQSLTEAVKASPGTLLVASLPASQIEVGGEGGVEALARLKQTFSRVESSWRPASQEESYEIVRRRLFKEIPGDKFHHRDNTLKQFAKLYRDNANDFPQGCADEDYRRKLEKAYPIHPELFDQLYTSWGSLEKFQRTRGVLRLMAQAIHELWMSADPSVMIMPGSVAVSSPRVEPELLHYLDLTWQSIIAGDVDGTASTPYRIDQSAPNLNRYSATRRVARAIFMGTAPTHQQQNTGLDDKQINLGVVQPGERPAIFGDALRRLTNQAKFMHADLGRYWYSMSASLNRIATDRAAQIENALVMMTIDNELTKYVNGLADHGHFDAVQAAPSSSAEVPDEAGGVRAVVLGVAHPHHGRDGSEALVEAKDILTQRGSTPRVYRNMLVFISADARQLDNLKDAVRGALAWGEIVRDKDRLNLPPSDQRLAETKLAEARETMKTRLKEAWCYLHYPAQESAQADVEWVSGKIPAQDGLLARASKKLLAEEGLLTELGPTRLDRDLQKYIWNGKPHLSLKDLREYLNRYIYLPRLKNEQVLVKAVQAAVTGMLPGPFAYAERWDEKTDAYLGLAIEQAVSAIVVIDSDSVIVRPDVAEVRRPAPAPPGPAGGPEEPGDKSSETGERPTGGVPEQPTAEKRPTRFTGTVMISAERPARDMHQIVEAIVEQLTTLPGGHVKLRLEIDAEIPSGLDRAKVRTLVENATTLGFIEKSVE